MKREHIKKVASEFAKHDFLSRDEICYLTGIPFTPAYEVIRRLERSEIIRKVPVQKVLDNETTEKHREMRTVMVTIKGLNTKVRVHVRNRELKGIRDGRGRPPVIWTINEKWRTW